VNWPRWTKRQPTKPQPPEPWYLVALRGGVYGLAAVLLLWRFALPQGVVAGVAGAFAGVVAAHICMRLRVRSGAVVAAGAGILLSGLAVGWLLTTPELPAQALGVGAALTLADMVEFGAGAAGFGLVLRGLAVRWSWISLVEVALITGVVCLLVAGHRDNAISEPRALSDWAWSRGNDPTLLLLGLGALTLVTVPLMLLVRQRAMKAALSVSALVFLGLVVFVLLRVDPPEPPPPRGTMGLAGKADAGKDEVEGRGRGRGGSGDKNDDEMPFKDDYPKGDAKPVAVVLFHDDYRAPEGYYYFRQTTFSQYNGYRLVRPYVRGADDDVPLRFAGARTAVPTAPYGGTDGIPAPRAVPSTVALMTEHKRPFGLVNPTSLESVPNPNPRHFRRAFKVESAAQMADWNHLVEAEAGDPEWTDEVRDLYVAYPEDERYEKLADEIVAGIRPEFRDKPVAQALAIKRWLEKNSFYTRKSSHAGQKDPVASFLFGSRRGYCVHLSHAMAFLLRARGVPARVSAGYAAPEERRGGGSALLLQNQDAHAWAEMYVRGFGWVIVDVSPEQSDEDGGEQVNRDLQRTFGELARGDDDAGRIEEPEEGRFKMAYAGLVAGPLFFLLLFLSYLVKLWRRVAPEFSSQRSLYRVGYRAGLDMLAEVGLLRQYGETREAFARRVAERAPAAQPLTRAHLARAFGGRDDLDREGWRRLLSGLRKQIATSTPWWRRTLGFVHPVSWFRVR
jgi:protein-glutamine gamma-glutamyltransferase